MSLTKNTNDPKTQNPSRTIRGLLLTAVSVGILCTAAGYSGMAQAQLSSPATDFLFSRSLLKQASYNEALSNGQVGTHKFSDSGAINSFYQSREHKPYWTSSRANLEKSRKVLSFLQESWTHGLNPADYHIDEISALLGQDDRDEGRLELLMTDAVARYGHDISGMRVNAAAANEQSKFWKQPLPASDVLTRLTQSEDPKTALESLTPNHPFYNRLREELVRLSRESAKYDDILPIKLGGKTFYPGDSSEGVKALRQRLDVEYDAAQGPEKFYDDNTAAAVMTFQRQNGLEADGVIGPKTLAMLNRSNRDQMEQVIANLERLRWMDKETPGRYIMVNIPSQTLWAVDGGKVAYEMPVIVGKPDRQTKAFRAEIKGIRFNPNWTVPMGIKMKDFLPKLQEDPTYLSQKGIEVYEGTGRERRTVDPTEVDWSAMTSRDMNQLSMVQKQGDNNALGRIRVLMPNDFDIYLHDTNTPEYFEKTERTLSSGCVRLSQPEDIARFVLSRNEDWSDEKMDATLKRGKTVEVSAQEPFPVFIVYQTMWLDADGNLVYGADVYKQDKRLIKAMIQANNFHIPESAGTRMADAVDKNNRKF